MPSLLQAILKLLIGLMVGYFVLWACAPMSSGPPPVPLAAPPEGAKAWDHAGRIGAATHVAVGPPLADSERELGYGVGTTLWAGRSLGERGEIGAVGDLTLVAQLGYVGNWTPISSAGGVYLRTDLHKNPNVVVGVSASGGWLWGAVGVPMGWRMTDRAWLYTHPEVGLDILGLGHVPLGLTLENSAGTGRMTAELGVHIAREWEPAAYVSVGYEARR